MIPFLSGSFDLMRSGGFMRNAHLFASIFVACLLMGSGCPALGQSDVGVVGVPANAARLPIPLGFVDTISGQVHLEIPIASIPEQRGGRPLDIKAVYDTTYYEQQLCAGCF